MEGSMSMKSRVVASALVCVSLAASAVIGGVSSVAGASVSHRAAPAAKANKSPLVFGSVGAISTNMAQNVDAVQAYFQAWNKAGGYKGHPLVLQAADPGSSSATDLAAVQQLVTADNVLALVGSEGSTDCTVGGSTMTQADV